MRTMVMAQGVQCLPCKCDEHRSIWMTWQHTKNTNIQKTVRGFPEQFDQLD